MYHLDAEPASPLKPGSFNELLSPTSFTVSGPFKQPMLSPKESKMETVVIKSNGVSQKPVVFDPCSQKPRRARSKIQSFKTWTKLSRPGEEGLVQLGVVCNCEKSKCVKLYCECFRMSGFCSEKCKCRGCLNNNSNSGLREKIVSDTLEMNPSAFRTKFKLHSKETINSRGCSCRKTECVKSYCECFRAQAGCTRLCKCIRCKNKQIEIDEREIPLLYERVTRKKKLKRQKAFEAVTINEITKRF